MILCGPHAFTPDDRDRTLALGRTLFDLLPGGFPADPDWPGAAHRAEAERLLDTVADTDPDGALTAFWATWRSAMEALRAAGSFGLRQEGEVAGLFTGDGGVPKHGQAEVEVGWSGLRGDRQDDRTSHGRPWQAVCLWAGEIVDAWAAEGHPIFAGAAGENISVRGLDWAAVVPGAQVEVGEVLLEVSAYAVPCQKNARWFADGSFGRLHHRHGPVSRVYATVLAPGAIRRGDPVVLEPSAP